MLREEKVGMLELSTDTTFTSKMQEAGMEGCGEGDLDHPAEHWWLPLPGKPGEQLPAGYDGLSLVHHGDDDDAQVLRRLK